MDVDPQWIALISACTAMIAAVAGPYVNTRIAGLQFKANVLSVNRQKWIETLRDLVSGLNSQLLTAAVVRQSVEEPTELLIARDPELFRRVEGLIRTAARSNSCSIRWNRNTSSSRPSWTRASTSFGVPRRSTTSKSA